MERKSLLKDEIKYLIDFCFLLKSKIASDNKSDSFSSADLANFVETLQQYDINQSSPEIEWLRYLLEIPIIKKNDYVLFYESKS